MSYLAAVKAVAAVAFNAVIFFGLGNAVAQSTDDQIWDRFVAWLPSAPPAASAGPIYSQYRARLIANGASEAEADKELATIRAMTRTRPEGRRLMFNNIYASDTPGFSTKPNALLVSAVKGRKPGRALDVGMGQGRNAVFLALEGWDVTGFDISDVGLKAATENAKSAGVHVNAVQQSREQFDFGKSQWDLIVITYETIPLETPMYVRRMVESLRPGGLIVIETFASETGTFNRRSTDVDPKMLLKAFDGFRIVQFEDTVAMPDWGDQQSRLARLVAEKRE